MSVVEILLLAAGLAMDATAVAAARALTLEHLRWGHVARVALAFGGAQALMSALGWWLGVWIGPLVQAWSHWLAFTVLAALGVKLLWDARHPPDPTNVLQNDPFGSKTLLLLSLATSVDAFAVGVTLPILNAPFALSIVCIGVVTAALTALGVLVGRRFGAMLGSRLDEVGGLALIALGIKLLIDGF